MKHLFIVLFVFSIHCLWADSVTLNPVKDNAIYEEGDLSNGAGDHLFAGQNNVGNNRRSLLAFNLTNAIPTNAFVTSVTLQLTNSLSAPGSGPRNIALHRLIANWGEGISDALNAEGQGAPAAMNDATWTNAFFGGALWAIPGGDFAAPSAVTLVDAEGIYNWSAVGMVDDVKFWIANGATNFGWIVIGDESVVQTAKRFDSRTSGAPPVLTINFTTNANEVVTNTVLAGVTFEKLRPKTGKRRNFVASKGTKIKGRVITTNVITTGTAFLKFASNQTAPVALIFKDFKRKRVVVGKKFKAKGVGIGSPVGETAYDVVIIVGNGSANASVTNAVGVSKVK